MSNSNRRGRPRKENKETQTEPEPEQSNNVLIATITNQEQTLNESIHEIILNDIPSDEEDKNLTDTLLDIILNEPKLKESIMNKIDNHKKGSTYSHYTDAHRRAQQKYRDKNREQYNESQKKVYERIKNDDDRREQHNKISRDNQRKYAEIKKQERISKGEPMRPRGRPKKQIAQTVEPEIKNGDNV